MITGAGVPWRPLALLAAGVSAVHWLALQGAPDTIAWQRPGVPLTVRAVAPAEPDPLAVPQAAETVSASTAMARPSLAHPAPPSRPLAAQPAPPRALVPASARWQYRVSVRQRGVEVSGRAELLWRHDGTRYEAELRIDAPPLPTRQQRSTGLLVPGGLQPLRFSERRRSEAATHFDRAGGHIVFSSNRPEAPLQEGAQDRLSVLIQLAALAAADPARLRPGTQIGVQTAGTREADRWTFTVEGDEDLELPAGPVRALRLARPPRGEYDPRLELWLGRADYGPVRLRLTAPNGDWLDLQWSGTDKG